MAYHPVPCRDLEGGAADGRLAPQRSHLPPALVAPDGDEPGEREAHLLFNLVNGAVEDAGPLRRGGRKLHPDVTVAVRHDRVWTVHPQREVQFARKRICAVSSVMMFTPQPAAGRKIHTHTHSPARARCRFWLFHMELLNSSTWRSRVFVGTVCFLCWPLRDFVPTQERRSLDKKEARQLQPAQRPKVAKPTPRTQRLRLTKQPKLACT